ncbi:flavin reductase family protein [Acidaminobacter sp. JC074]|uniref:flavin reductase family protein n=1 Tax=Acidaminobacter sp. JC074 TaxID=2530199 RepID=UPI001F0CF359|nr:flavin reductase family protein [Acidaminobacter sp. JC074]MCH4889230.1 flavin reductase family protein [Acidaminobacter sp. JC074]
MQKNIGSVNGLYPMPVTIVGTQVDGRVNWINIAHVGIVAGDMMLSMGKRHHSNIGIRKNKTLSINLLDASMMIEADYVGLVSGNSTDKSEVFDYYKGQLEGAPLIKNAPLVMECEVIDVYETDLHEHFIVRSLNTYVEEDCLDTDGNIDFLKVNPLLFEMSKRRYLSLGDEVGMCWHEGKKMMQETSLR